MTHSWQEYSVIGDSRVLSWVCHIDSFSTVLLVNHGSLYWKSQYDTLMTVTRESPITLYWKSQYDSLMTVDWWITNNTVLKESILHTHDRIGITNNTVLKESIWHTHDSVIGDSRSCHECVNITLFQYSVIGDSNPVLKWVNMTHSWQCYWESPITLYWKSQYDTLSDSDPESPITLYWKSQYDTLIGDRTLRVNHQ